MAEKPTHEEIAVRAYEIYSETDGEDGHDVEHWLLAEQELLGEHETAEAKVKK